MKMNVRYGFSTATGSGSGGISMPKAIPIKNRPKALLSAAMNYYYAKAVFKSLQATIIMGETVDWSAFEGISHHVGSDYCAGFPH